MRKKVLYLCSILAILLLTGCFGSSRRDWSFTSFELTEYGSINEANRYAARQTASGVNEFPRGYEDFRKALRQLLE